MLPGHAVHGQHEEPVPGDVRCLHALALANTRAATTNISVFHANTSLTAAAGHDTAYTTDSPATNANTSTGTNTS